MKKTLFTAVFCLVAAGAFAQTKSVNRAFNEAKMESPNFSEARENIQGALTNPETQDVAKTWYVAGYIENRAFDNNWTMRQMNQSVDEGAMYNALYDCYEYYLKAAALDTLPDEKGKVKPKYLKDIRNTLKKNHDFFRYAGGYYFNEGDFNSACKVWGAYLEIPKIGFMDVAKLPMDTLYQETKFNSAIAAMRAENNKLAIQYLEDLKDSDYDPKGVYDLLIYGYNMERDTVNLINTLKEAADKIVATDEDFQYIPQLINLYITSGNYDEAIEYLKKVLTSEPMNAEYWKVLGGLYGTLEKEEKAIECLNKAIEINPEYVDALGELGRIYYNRAVNYNGEISAISDNNLYRQEKEAKVIPAFKQALPYYEKAHQLNPEEYQYKVALRGIYYNLGDAENLKLIESEIDD